MNIYINDDVFKILFETGRTYRLYLACLSRNVAALVSNPNLNYCAGGHFPDDLIADATTITNAMILSLEEKDEQHQDQDEQAG